MSVENEKKEAADQPEKKAETPAEEIIQTQHSIEIDGKNIPYTATTGTIHLKEEDERKYKAEIFFIAYTRDDVEDLSQRPITFCFNGGPGSSSVWLHMGVFGPKRVVVEKDVKPLPPPCQVVENSFSILDATDLVFIDPVSTGFSRPAADTETPIPFHAVEKDIESVGDFIRKYTTRYKRWRSPKFIAGESYGTTRAAGLSGYLQDRIGMYLNGIMLISSILDFQTARFDVGNDLPYQLFLPTYAATAWFHGKVSHEKYPTVQDLLKDVEVFASQQYPQALLKGTALSDAERTRVVRRLAQFTGLDSAYIEQTNLRIEILRFVKQLMRDQKRTVGRLDTRFLGIDRDAVGEHFEADPSYNLILGPYTAAFNDYVRNDLEFESDLLYEAIAPIISDWDYGKYKNRYLNVAETLRAAMSRNPYLQVLVANGYYDLATPYYATEYTINHMGLDPELQENIHLTYYEAGHMMYVHEPSLEKLKTDLVEFIQRALPAKD